MFTNPGNYRLVCRLYLCKGKDLLAEVSRSRGGGALSIFPVHRDSENFLDRPPGINPEAETGPFLSLRFLNYADFSGIRKDYLSAAWTFYSVPGRISPFSGYRIYRKLSLRALGLFPNPGSGVAKINRQGGAPCRHRKPIKGFSEELLWKPEGPSAPWLFQTQQSAPRSRF